jgi:peptidyl-prolyl cis-trans isomerase SurA
MDIRHCFNLLHNAGAGGAACVKGLLFLCLLLGVPSLPGSEIDRLLVAVNGKVITEGDLSLARSLNEVILYDQSARPNSRASEIDRLIDLELMRQELQSFSMTQEDESSVEARLQALRDAYAAKGGLPFFLNKLGLQESELIAYLRLQSSIMKFVNFRFRPFVKVSKEEIKNYYEGRLADQLREANLSLPPLAQVSGRIEEVLKEEKVNAALEQWITEIRRNSRIEYFTEQPDLKLSGTESLDK